jgi:hypothetical protein
MVTPGKGDLESSARMVPLNVLSCASIVKGAKKNKRVNAKRTWRIFLMAVSLVILFAIYKNFRSNAPFRQVARHYLRT